MHSLNAGDLGLFQNFNICDKVSPANAEDGAEIAMMKAHEMYVTAVGDPNFSAIEESGKNHNSVDQNLFLLPQAFVTPNMFVQPSK